MPIMTERTAMKRRQRTPNKAARRGRVRGGQVVRVNSAVVGEGRRMVR